MEQEETFEKFYIQGIPNTRNLQLNESKFSFNLQQMHTYNACLKLFIPKNYYNFSISINWKKLQQALSIPTRNAMYVKWYFQTTTFIFRFIFGKVYRILHSMYYGENTLCSIFKLHVRLQHGEKGNIYSMVNL